MPIHTIFRPTALLFAAAVIGTCVSSAQLPGVSSAPAPSRNSQDSTPRIPASMGPQGNQYLGSIPSGEATNEVIDLTIADAMARAVQYNLALAETGEDIREQRAERLRALSRLLPDITARPSVSEQQINLAAFGFTGFPGVPSVVGPFSIYDARAYLNQSIFNLQDLRNHRAAREQVAAAEFMARDVREQVALISSGLYLIALAGSSRVDAQRAQVATAEAAYKQASDRRAAGTVPGIDVLRAQVEFQSEQQRLIYYEGEFEKQKLNLARAIGLPPGQQVRLTDHMRYEPVPPVIPIEPILATAYKQRADYQAAEASVRAAELARSAAVAGRYPTATLDANYGVIGPVPDQMHGTFAVSGTVNIPIFQGGRVQADVERADAELRRRRAEFADLRSRIDADVRTALTDLRSSSRQVEVAVKNVDLAKEQLQQSQDRFAAGVTNNLEVVQAQQAVALANENYIAALYSYAAAQSALVRARGDAEKSITEYLRRTK